MMNKLLISAVLLIATIVTMIATPVGDLMFQSNSGADSEINLLGGIGFLAIMLITVYVMSVYTKKIQDEKSEGKLADETWDGIGEYKNPFPIGWGVVQVITIVWAVWYWLVAYPPQSFSQIGQFNQEVSEYQGKFEAKWANADDATLSAMGESIFLSNCAQCHGNLADGMDGRAADLTKRLDAVAVKHAIVNGSNNGLIEGVPMPDRNGLFNMNTGMPISDAEIEEVSNYVANGFTGAGAETFAGVCSACHGADGNGMAYVAPNIRAFDTALITHIAKNGKKGASVQMPAYNKASVLTDVQYKAVATYITSLSK
jgi:cytochrome c oxidase cbb3-type subunit 3